MFTTISLVGYGSYMQSDYSYIVIMLTLPIIFIMVPDQSTEMVRIFQKKSIYARHSYTSMSSTPHIDLLGTVS